MHLESNDAELRMIDFDGKKQHYVDMQTGSVFTSNNCGEFITK